MANKLYIFIVAAIAAVMLCGGWSVPTAFADAPTQPTTALEDLRKDDTFDISDYPDDPKDYAIHLIQIAESVDKELFVYTYQPCQKTTYLVATDINMSLSETADGTKLYTLSLVNNDGVLCKYRVNDLTVKSDIVRHYNITSIYREWLGGIDSASGNDNTVNGVAFNVGKLYSVTTINGNTVYACKDLETIEVTDKYVGYVNYPDGYDVKWSGVTNSVTSAHFVAFDTDKPIDTLMTAEVQFMEQPSACKLCGNVLHLNHTYETFFDYSYGAAVRHDPIMLEADNIGNNGAQTYTWKRIQRTSEFISDEANKGYTLTASGASGFENTKWVLNFYETAVTAKATNDSWKGLVFGGIGAMFMDDIECKFTRVSEVTVLRLKFETDGTVYDLGTVDNKQSGGNEAFTPPDDAFALFPSWVWWIVGAVLLAILIPVLSALFPVVGRVVLWIFKGLWWLISAPFKGIAALIEKIRERKGG